MKLVKLVSNPDWIRFSKDLEVEVNNMITAKVNATVGLYYKNFASVISQLSKM
jgi:hypothetical protein